MEWQNGAEINGFDIKKEIEIVENELCFKVIEENNYFDKVSSNFNQRISTNLFFDEQKISEVSSTPDSEIGDVYRLKEKKNTSLEKLREGNNLQEKFDDLSALNYSSDQNNFDVGSGESSKLIGVESLNSKRTLRQNIKCHSENSFIGQVDKQNLTHKGNSRNTEVYHSNSKLVCSICDKSFTTERFLKLHFLSHSDEKKFSCRICDSKFHTIGKWTYHHKKVHYEEKQFVCTICNKSFATKNNFKVHILFHSNERPFGQVNKQNLMHKGNSRKTEVCHFKSKFVCSTCNKSFTTEHSLKFHFLSHSDEKQFSCGICDSKFQTIGKLNYHKKIHIVEKQIVCAICNESFTSKSNFQVHILLHSNERTFSCNKCENVYHSKRKLNCHMMSHSNVKSFVCTLCEVPFKTKSTLQTHMATHLSERPFCCNVCEKTFKFQAGLYQHQFTHSNKRPFGCIICEKKFKRKCILTVHMLTHSRKKFVS